MVLNKMKTVFFVLIAVLAIGGNVDAQNVKTRKDIDKKSLKIYKEAISEGRKKNYDKSLKLYEKVLKKHPEFLDAQLRKAGMFHNMSQYEKSATEFEKAIAMAPEYDPQMYFSLAIVNRDLKRYDLAARNFQFFIDRTENEKKKEKAIDYRDRSQFAHEAISNPVPFEPVLLTGGVNSSHSEYVPKLNIEGTQLIFTRRVNQQEDFYAAKIENGEVIEVEEMYGLNTVQNEGVHTISADGRTMIFTACDRRKTGIGSCDLYYSFLEIDGWSLPSNMGKVINSISWDGQPSLSSDGKKLFFSSGRQDGYGGNDIWMSTRTDTSGWSNPKVLSDVINTKGSEESPFIHPDGHTLYFRSNKHIGMGGFDIFYSRYIDSTDTWMIPENIGYPINTEGDEGALSVSLDGKKAYFTSDMAYLDDKANANLDIYSFDLYHNARPMPSTFVKAKIIDKETRTPLKANYSIVPIKKSISALTGRANREGSFITSLPTDMDYAFFVDHHGYVLYSGDFTLDGIQDVKEPFILEIEMTPVPKVELKVEDHISEPIVLKNIFFESGSAVLKNESNIEIARLAENLMNNITLNIEIHGHTDNIGSEENNMKLSEDRAKSVMMALIDKGISSSRVSFKGYGENKPIDSNETEEGRKNNRRTEFVVK